MRKLILVISVLAPGALAYAGDLPCALTEQDKKSLMQVANPLDDGAIAALDDADKKNLCLSRRLVSRAPKSDSDAEADALAAQLTIDDIPQRMSRFVTREEYGRLRRPIAKVIARAMAQKGMAR